MCFLFRLSNFLDNSKSVGIFSLKAPWAWVEAGACTVDPSQPPNWFADSGLRAGQGPIEESWRLKILEELKARGSTDKYKGYEMAVETTSWVHSGEARVSWGSGPFVDCILQLEWVQTTGTLTVLNPDGASTMVILFPVIFTSI